MNHLPALNLLERLALWILVRSPRTSLVLVKEHFWPELFYAVDPSDPTVKIITDGVKPSDPPSMILERIFHQPAHGESE